MAKIIVKGEVPDGKYCEDGNTICPMCFEHEWGTYRCVIFDNELELDEDNHWCIRCDKCKQAEVQDDM